MRTGPAGLVAGKMDSGVANSDDAVGAEVGVVVKALDGACVENALAGSPFKRPADTTKPTEARVPRNVLRSCCRVLGTISNVVFGW